MYAVTELTPCLCNVCKRGRRDVRARVIEDLDEEMLVLGRVPFHRHGESGHG